MNTRLKRLIKPTVFLSLLCPSGTFLADSSTALAAVASPRVQIPTIRAVNRKADLSKILSVLEIKMGAHTLPGKVKDKLSTLTDGQIRLIASLSDRIADEGHTPSADIAFLLIAALIILS